MTTAATEHVVTKTYEGPCRRKTSDEKREQYTIDRRLRMEQLNWFGRRALYAIGGIALMYVGYVQHHILTGNEAMKTQAVLVKTVDDLASAVDDIQKREREETRRQDEANSKIIVQLETLNTQFLLMREEAQRRTVRGEDR